MVYIKLIQFRLQLFSIPFYIFIAIDAFLSFFAKES